MTISAESIAKFIQKKATALVKACRKQALMDVTGSSGTRAAYCKDDFTEGASALAPALLLAVNTLKDMDCKSRFATVFVHDSDCRKCEALAEIEKMLETKEKKS